MGNLTSRDGEYEDFSSEDDDDDDDVSVVEPRGAPLRRKSPRLEEKTAVVPAGSCPWDELEAPTTRRDRKTVQKVSASAGTKRKAKVDGTISNESGSASSAAAATTNKPAKKRAKRLTWEERYEQLKAFKEKYKHTRVPATREWKTLYGWLQNSKNRKNGPYMHYQQLMKVQIDKLDKLGIDWCSNGTSIKENSNRWDKNCELLKSFKEEHGHTQVPATGEWKPLYDWLSKTKKRKNGPHDGCTQLTAKQIEMLDKVGISWHNNTAAHRSWDVSFAEVEAFHKKNGHCKVPHKKEPRLSQWLRTQRNRRQSLSQKQVEKLKSVGVDWA